MPNSYPHLIIGYHGCDRAVCESVINGKSFQKSKNPYDWLGNGIYFWENDRKRALEWAQEQSERGKIKEPAVIGAVLNLGNCLDLMERESIELLRVGYSLLELKSKLYNIDIPKNYDKGKNKDLLMRERDCAVIQQIHELTHSTITDMKPYDSVRGLFLEGDEVYPGSGFRKKTHIQICVVNPNCIIGCFLPRKQNRTYPEI